MTRREALLAALLGIVMLTAGFVWMFGAYGLIGGGSAVVLAAFFSEDKSPDSAVIMGAELERLRAERRQRS